MDVRRAGAKETCVLWLEIATMEKSFYPVDQSVMTTGTTLMQQLLASNWDFRAEQGFKEAGNYICIRMPIKLRIDIYLSHMRSALSFQCSEF